MNEEQAHQRSRRPANRRGLGIVVKEFRATVGVLPAFGAALLGRPATTAR